VEQRILFVRTEAERDAALHRQLQLVPATARVLIFVSTKKTCETLARSLRREHTCAALHGDKDQSERERTLSEFRSGVVPVLIATDVAARGLDIPVRDL
jgi:superfamily II DNA/RNA helicase